MSGDEKPSGPRPLIYATGRNGQRLELVVLDGGCAILCDGKRIARWDNTSDQIEQAVDRFLKICQEDKPLPRAGSTAVGSA